MGRDSEISNDRKLSVGLHALPNSQDSFVQDVPPIIHRNGAIIADYEHYWATELHVTH